MSTRRMPAFVAGAIFATVVGGGTAIAATGGNFILGRSNTAGATSSLSNANGTALALSSKAGTPSLRVNTAAKVPNLNADRLDNLDSTNFARAGGATGSFSIGGQLVDGDGNGLDDTILAVASCPAGTQMTGGGSADFTATGFMFLDAPDDQEPESWVVAVAIDENTTEDPADVTASVVCYNPRGAVPGGFLTGTSTLRDLSPKLAAKVAAKAASR
jgi:hypothetical protein